MNNELAEIGELAMKTDRGFFVGGVCFLWRIKK